MCKLGLPIESTSTSASASAKNNKKEKDVQQSPSFQEVSTSKVAGPATSSTAKRTNMTQLEHYEPLWQQLYHWDEIVDALQLVLLGKIPNNFATKDSDLQWCNFILNKTARPFAMACRQLPQPVLTQGMVLHHALRALDTIEDDMDAFEVDLDNGINNNTTSKYSNDDKIQILYNFVATALSDPTWSLEGVGEEEPYEALLLKEFPKVHRVFCQLHPEAQAIIKDVTHRMAVGMVEFIQAHSFSGPTTIEQYEQYCYAVAGLVGEGLVRLYVLNQLEQPQLAKKENIQLAYHVGYFLQKVNIIRDFREDYIHGRVFWPSQIWSKYATSLEYLLQADGSEEDESQLAQLQRQQLSCLNEMVNNALQEVPHILNFLSKFECVETYRSVALLGLGSMLILDKAYNNPKVFTGKIRFRKALAAQMALQCDHPDAVKEWFYKFATSIEQRALEKQQKRIPDPTIHETLQLCRRIQDMTQTAHASYQLALEKKKKETFRNLKWYGMLGVGMSMLARPTFLVSLFGGMTSGRSSRSTTTNNNQLSLVQPPVLAVALGSVLGLGGYFFQSYVMPYWKGSTTPATKPNPNEGPHSRDEQTLRPASEIMAANNKAGK